MSKVDVRLGRELSSFYALAVMNVVAGAVAMGLSMSYGVQSTLEIVRTLPAIAALYSLPLAVMAFSIFGVAMRWLVSSAEIFGEAQEIRDEFENREVEGRGGTTSIIVKTMALYRERKSTIEKMAWVSRLAGILLLGIAAYNIASCAIFGVRGDVSLTFISIAMNLAMGAVALYIPHLFSFFSRAWDSRLAQGERAEGELRRILEGGA